VASFITLDPLGVFLGWRCYAVLIGGAQCAAGSGTSRQGEFVVANLSSAGFTLFDERQG
jgi:hypothetical protein